MTETEGLNTKLKKIIAYINNGLPKKRRIEEEENPNDNIDLIIKMFENHLPIKQKKGKYKLPFRVKAGVKKYHKKNKLIVFLIKGKTLVPVVKQMINNMVNIDGNLHTIPIDCIMMYNGKTPCIVLPSWQVTPFEPLTPDELYQDSEKKHSLVEAQTYMIRAIKKAAVPEMLKRKLLSPMGMIGGVIAVGLIWYVFFGG